uniref:Uncharacterized protein n=1 Tax=Arundo donax TaxID=35708 RepID=A0A0A9GUP8_ARUDO
MSTVMLVSGLASH